MGLLEPIPGHYDNYDPLRTFFGLYTPDWPHMDHLMLPQFSSWNSMQPIALIRLLWLLLPIFKNLQKQQDWLFSYSLVFALQLHQSSICLVNDYT